MYSYHGLIGEQIPLATGFVLATRRPGVVYFGDAASEEDYALTTFGFAATHRLPVLFVCEDNDLSILTPSKDRRNWNVYDVAASMGLAVANIEDDPSTIHRTVSGLLEQLPAFVNIKTCRHFWHAGIGMDGPPRRDRLREYADTVPGAESIERQAEMDMERLWHERLPRP